MEYKRTSPCTTCPYRKDVKLKTWDKAEFKDLLANDQTQMGTVYACHKKDGHVCVGWLMDQYKRGLPSIMLRLSLLKNKVNIEYSNSLNCDADMYKSIRDMIRANYPQLLKNRS